MDMKSLEGIVHDWYKAQKKASTPVRISITIQGEAVRIITSERRNADMRICELLTRENARMVGIPSQGIRRLTNALNANFKKNGTDRDSRLLKKLFDDWKVTDFLRAFNRSQLMQFNNVDELSIRRLDQMLEYFGFSHIRSR